MRCLFFIIFILFSVTLFSQHNHGSGEHDENEKAMFKHSPQHGGEILDAGKHKLEIVINPMQQEEKLTVYVLKKNYKEIELKEATATLVLKYKNEKVDSVKMEILPDKFTTDKIDLTKPVNIFFRIQIGAKIINATHFYEGLKRH